MTRSRTEIFEDVWLSEMPKKISVGRNMFSEIVNDISERIKYNLPVNKTSIYNLYSLGENTVFYWTSTTPWVDSFTKNEENLKQYLNTIQVAVEMIRDGQNLQVKGAGKKAGTTQSPADVYQQILRDQKTKSSAIRLKSDDMMSAGGFNIWKEILKNNHLSYYDTVAQQIFPIRDESHLSALFGDDDSFKQYQYVMAENVREFGEILGEFQIRKTRRLAGYPRDAW